MIFDNDKSDGSESINELISEVFIFHIKERDV